MSLHYWTGFCALMLGTGCFAEPTSQNESTVKIVGGVQVSPQDPEYLATVSLLNNAGQTHCSGVLVDSRTVLTAAHCLGKIPSRVGFGSKAYPDTYSEQEIRSYQVKAHHLWRYPHTVTPPWLDRPLGDFGAIFLLEDAPSWTRPTPIKMIGDVPEGSRMVIAGFGQTRSPVQPFGILHKTEVLLDGVNHTANEIIWKSLPGHNGSSCYGDSGGPMFFVEQDATLTLVGVTSRGLDLTHNCSHGGVYTDARKYTDWIEENRNAVQKLVDWNHHSFRSENGVNFQLDFKLDPSGSQIKALEIWINLYAPSPESKVVAKLANRLAGYHSQEIELTLADPDSGRFTGEFTEFRQWPVSLNYMNADNWLEVFIDGEPLLDPISGRHTFTTDFSIQ